MVQAGLYFLTPPVGAQAFTLAITGTSMGGHNLVALGISYSWFGDVQSIFMLAAVHAARLSELYKLRCSMALALGLAILVGFTSCLYFVLTLCCKCGADNFGF